MSEMMSKAAESRKRAESKGKGLGLVGNTTSSGAGAAAASRRRLDVSPRTRRGPGKPRRPPDIPRAEDSRGIPARRGRAAVKI